MIKLSVKVDIAGAIKKLDATKEAAATALPRALNKTATTARAEAARQIRSTGYNIKIGAIKKSLAIRRANRNTLVATVRASGRPIPLIQYSAKEKKGRGGGVTVTVLRGRKFISDAFIATMPSGHRGVFKRYGKKQKRHGKESGLRIRELFGPSIPAAFANDAVMSALESVIKDRFEQVFLQELRYAGLPR